MNAEQPTNTNHYHQPQLLESILAKFHELGLDDKNIRREDIAGMDEFHLQGAAVSKALAAKAGLSPQSKVLDVGCGIGGPCRMMADEFGCMVTGIDYTSEYIRTARALTSMVGLDEKIEFQQADALQLPFKNAEFDVVWTQHAQMNIADKAQFYSEIQRVLKLGGRFVYYDIFSTGSEDIYYPVPWAETPTSSYLITHSAVATYFNKSYYHLEFTEDHTQSSTTFLTKVLEKAKSGNVPPLGLNMLMRESTQEKLSNLLKCLIEKKVEVHAGIYSKQ